MGDVLGRGLQVGEMNKMAERLDAALNIKGEGGAGGLLETKGRPCKVGGG